ncbi:MAG: M15 family metallopeptidase [Polyangiaceae bacterium]|nr:M15 family metallopeptidase [Polyangiaceae bacterium]
MRRLHTGVVWLVLAACAHPTTDGMTNDASAANANEDGAAQVIEGSQAVEASTAVARKASSTLDRFGTEHVTERGDRELCTGIGSKHIADRDLRTSFIDGNDLLALVNRSPTGALAPSFAPSDLVEIGSTNVNRAMGPRDCDKTPCLRKEAASALDELMREMKQRGFAGKVQSAFRSYTAQCRTFLHWAEKSSFCDATEQSALPGHSQHQLGTTVDMFTEAWAKDARGVFRDGFGCTPAGQFLREHAWNYGFVMPYPLHPDDRHPKRSCVPRSDIAVSINPKTGYRFEHWHIRYVGKDAAARFNQALLASGPGTPNELTVEQWLRREKALDGPDTELPVCDGCNCGACATLAEPGQSVCDKKNHATATQATHATHRNGALFLDNHGRPLPAAGAPVLKDAKIGRTRTNRDGSRTSHTSVIEIALDVPEHVLTQPPIFGPGIQAYMHNATFETFAPYSATSPRAFPPLAGTWSIGIEPVPNTMAIAWPWRAAIAAPEHGMTYNRANVVLPAQGGSVTIAIGIADTVTRVRVVLLEGGVAKGEPLLINAQ